MIYDFVLLWFSTFTIILNAMTTTVITFHYVWKPVALVLPYMWIKICVKANSLKRGVKWLNAKSKVNKYPRVSVTQSHHS